MSDEDKIIDTPLGPKRMSLIVAALVAFETVKPLALDNIASVKEALEGEKARLALARDRLRDIVDEAATLVDDTEQACEDLNQICDSLSKYV